MKKFRLDKINLALLNSLVKEKKINYSKLGKQLGLSHVSIKNRFERLIDKKIIKHSILLNFSKLDFKIGLILLEVDSNALERLLNIYQKCPRVIYYFELIGQYNLALMFFGESEKTFQTILKSCMLYSLEGIHKSNILTYRNPPKDFFFPFNFSLIDQENEETPCATSCKNCGVFKKESCFGCPASKYYNGPLKITD